MVSGDEMAGRCAGEHKENEKESLAHLPVTMQSANRLVHEILFDYNQPAII